MAYTYYPYQPNYFQPTYQPMAQQNYQPMNQPMNQSNQQAQQQSSQSIIWVQNEQEAYSYLVAPNSAVALWDSNLPVIYLKQADASGKPSIKTYDLVERTQRPVQANPIPSVEYAPLSRLEALEARIDALAAVKEPSRPAKKTSSAATKEDAE